MAMMGSFGVYPMGESSGIMSLIGDVIPFGKRSLYPNQMTEGGRPYEGSAGRIVQFPALKPLVNAMQEAAARYKPTQQDYYNRTLYNQLNPDNPLPPIK